jgi:hypothetical protein
MKRLLTAAIVPMLTAGLLGIGTLGVETLGIGSSAFAQESSPISPAQLEKILKFVDTIGAKQEFPPPTARDLGLSTDPNKTLPVVVVVTDNHKVYFCRSTLNPTDYIIWSRNADAESSYMFLTHADLKLVRALYLHEQAFPRTVDAASSQVQTIYNEALTVLAKDVDKSSSH